MQPMRQLQLTSANGDLPSELLEGAKPMSDQWVKCNQVPMGMS
jgi:hypothetical protein